MANLDDIILAAQECFEEFGEGKATDAAKTPVFRKTLIRFANEWQKDLGLFIKYPRKNGTLVNSTEGTAEYSNPSDFVSIVKLFFKVDGDKFKEFEYIHYENMAIRFGDEWSSADNGTPEVFYFPNSTQYAVHPKPNTLNSGTGYIKLDYHNLATPLSESYKTIEVPEGYHQTAQYFIAAKAHEKIGNPAMHDRLMGFYENQRLGYKPLIETRAKQALRMQWG